MKILDTARPVSDFAVIPCVILTSALVSAQKTGSSGHQLWLCLYPEDVCITLASSSLTWHWQHKHNPSAGRITDDNKILVYCNEIKSNLIHLKYSRTVERVSYKYINLTTLSCHQSTGAWRTLRSAVTGTWDTPMPMSGCSIVLPHLLLTGCDWLMVML